MAAAFPHNSFYTRDAARGYTPHRRNESMLSTSTLYTEPLLPHRNGVREANTSRDGPGSPSTRNHRWGTTDESTYVETGKLSPWKFSRQQPSRRLRWTRYILEFLISGWAVYTAMRYFWAFTIFDSWVGQAVSLSLGTASGLSFAFICCAAIWHWRSPSLILHGLSYPFISRVYWFLTYSALFFIFAPAAVNFALLFVWRNTTDLELRPKYRCYMDIDIIWSRRDELCRGKATTWGFWIVLSAIRLTVTGCFILGYQLTLRRLLRTSPMTPGRQARKHRSKPSNVLSYHTPMSRPASAVPFPLVAASPIDPRHQSNVSLLSSRTGASPRANRALPSVSSGVSTEARSTTTAPTSTTHGNLQPVPEQENDKGDLGRFSNRFSAIVNELHRETEDALRFARSNASMAPSSITSPAPSAAPEARLSASAPPPLATPSRGQVSSDEESDSEDEDEARVRAHLTKDDRPYTLARLNEEADDDDDDDDDDDFYGQRAAPPPTVGYNEFGQPYPAEQSVAVMNGYVRRMPTIESMGSREMGSSVAASSLLGRFSVGSSRPPTRNTLSSMLSGSGSGSDGSLGQRGDGAQASPTPSRPTSLMVQSERVAAAGLLSGKNFQDTVTTTGTAMSNGTNSSIGSYTNAWPTPQDISEIGELVESVRVVRKVPAPDSPSKMSLPRLQMFMAGGTTGSASSADTAYYTAPSPAATESPVVPIPPQATSSRPGADAPVHRFF